MTSSVIAGAPGVHSLAAPAWIVPETAALRGAFRGAHLPHALLIHEAPGAGGEWLARWAAMLVLCEHPERAPCGECRGCRRVALLQHPDLSWVTPLEDSRQIRIEQVRDLAADLALTSHASGYKVGVITPADALNRFAANALLKTLEEPPARTLLVLVATQPSRLPPTIVSRCQRLKVRAPTRAEAIEWLSAARGPGDWNAALETLGEAPMLAALSDPGELAEVGTDTRRSLDALAAGREDPVAVAERWARGDFALRLLCFEKWLTERIRRSEPPGAFLPEMRSGPYLSVAGGSLNIRRLFALGDELRDLRASLDVPLNRGVALEALLRRIAAGERTN